MMPKQPWWPDRVQRLACYLIVALFIIAACGLLTGCEFLTGVARVFGAHPSSGAEAAARKVDEALGGWFGSLFFSSDTLKVAAGAATTETARYVHRVRKKRKEHRAKTPSTTHAGGAS